jgi:GTPase SAR1 family protein
MRDLYMRNGQGFMLVYAINDCESLAEATKLYQQIVRQRETYNVISISKTLNFSLIDPFHRDLTKTAQIYFSFPSNPMKNNSC